MYKNTQDMQKIEYPLIVKFVSSQNETIFPWTKILEVIKR